MPRFEPFAGLRYTAEDLDEVAAPPYDVISPDDRAALVGRSEHNAVRLELPEPEDGRDRYATAAVLLEEWRAAGVLRADVAPAFYIYRMRFADESGTPRTTTGVIGSLAIDAAGAGDVLPHEHTMPKPKDDRLNLLRATRANLSPIWGLSLSAGLSDQCRPDGAGIGPAQRAVDLDGVVHELWPLTDPARLAAVVDAVASAPVVIADGHHRYETATAYRGERRSANGDQAGDHDLVMAYVVELADEQLSVRAIHRLIAGLPAGFDLVEALERHFEISPTAAPDPGITTRMAEAGSLALVTTAGTWLLRPRPTTVDAAEYDLDSSRLDVALADLPDHQLTYQHGWDLADAAVQKGEADAAVLLRPATVAQISETGHAGGRMPPKTTFFWPKPRTGLVFRVLAD